MQRPLWMEVADRLLSEAMGQIRLLGALTPVDAARERARLVLAFERGGEARPNWTYTPVDYAGVRRALASLADGIEGDGQAASSALSSVYAARARELMDEAALASVAGTALLGANAPLRFAPSADAAEASRLAHAWLDEDAPPAPSAKRATIMSDAEDGASLLGRMREAVGRARLPFTVLAESQLASLAATGERTILIAVGRAVSEEDIARTVLHEIEAHARPRARAQQILPRIFRLGTARGADEQEGLALFLESRHGFLGHARRRELGARHIAVEAMRQGATFIEGVRALMKVHALDAKQAVLVCERAYRGGDGERAGLGREIVYIESFLRVRRAIERAPEDERVLSSGQVATAALDALRPFAAPAGAATLTG